MINLTSILAGLSSIFPEFLFGYFGGMELQLELQYKSRVILGNFCFISNPGNSSFCSYFVILAPF